MREPCDQSNRERARADLSTTFLVEAGAGTGKTRLLVDRFIACLLRCGSVRRVVAITFTDKAAAELRLRVRARLREMIDGESALEGSSTSTQEREVLHEALRDIDQAPISTIHAFAARLLRESPVEAGVDPGFRQLDALGSRLLFDELWDEWLGAVLSPSAPIGGGSEDDAEGRLGEDVAELLQAGVEAETLRTLARQVFASRFDVGEEAPSLPGAAFAALDARLRPRVVTLVAAFDEQIAHACAVCGDQSDRGYLAAVGCVEALDVVRDALSLSAGVHHLAAAVANLKPVPATAGKQENWGGKQGKAAFQERCAVARDLQDEIVKEYGAVVAAEVLRAARAFSHWAAEAQMARGYLDFSDLLGRLRDALRADRGLRARWQRAFDYLLIDEFQDTDPLQAEIVLLLAEDEPLAVRWRDVALRPGKLFVVGDPKQSIYRFRRADIAMYDDVKRLIQEGGGEVLSISQNFRTVPSVIQWVNEAFARAIGDDAAERRQPDYTPLAAFREEPDGEHLVARPPALETGGPAADGPPSAAGSRPRVLVVCGPVAEPRADPLRAAEAEALAATLVRGIDGGEWRVRDRQSDVADGGRERWRPARWSDVTVLVRAGTGLDVYERALRRALVPCHVEAGKSFYQRREVRDALLGLRAVSDPADPLAVYGALHSTLFGFEDERLYLFHAEGGSFDYLAEQPPDADAAVCAALAELRAVHAGAHARPVDATLDDLLRRVWAFEAAAAWGDGAGQVLRNLLKLRQQARAFSREEGAGLPAFVRWAEQQRTAALETESPPDDTGDAVRVMTMHGAKGLEFPIAVLVGAWSPGGGNRDSAQVLLDRDAGRFEVGLKLTRLGSPYGPTARELRASTPGCDALLEAEKLMEASERRRLLYVAATRAMDLLVITFPGWAQTKSGSLLEPLEALFPDPASVEQAEVREAAVFIPAPAAARAAVAPPPPLDLQSALAARERGRAQQARADAAARRPLPATSPSTLEDLDLRRVSAGDDGAAFARGRRTALALGAAVHRVMEAVPLGAPQADAVPADVLHCMRVLADEALAEGGVAEGTERAALAEQVVRMVRACWLSEPLRRAAGAARVFRELPLCALLRDDSVDRERGSHGASGPPGDGEAGRPPQAPADGTVGQIPGLPGDGGADRAPEAPAEGRAGMAWQSPSAGPLGALVAPPEASVTASPDASAAAAGGAPARQPLFLEGYCDLLFSTAEGWTVVDYKTDRELDEERMRRRYELQAGGYALAVRQVTGERVARAVFVLVGPAATDPGRPAGLLEIAVTDDLLRRAWQRAAETAGQEPPSPGD